MAPQAYLVNADLYNVHEFLTQPVRPEDEAEWMAGLGEPVRLALPQALDNPEVARMRCLIWEGEPVAIFGVSRSEKGYGVLWLVGRDIKLPLGITFLTFWREELDALHDAGGEKLVALADDRNPKHHLWLKAMGFTVLSTNETPGVDKTITFTAYGRTRT